MKLVLIIVELMNFSFVRIISLQMDILKKWLSRKENSKTISEHELSMILCEFQWKTIALRGGRLFTFSYSLLWNVKLKIHHISQFSWTVVQIYV